MLQVVLILAIFIALIAVVGKYLYKIAVEQHTIFDNVFDKLDGGIYKICHIDKTSMGWKQYAKSLIITNAVIVIITFIILKLQGILFLNPNQIDGMESSLSFNTVISFMTNTNLQHYAGESGLSYFSQMTVIIFMMFTSAATGYAAAMAFARGIVGRDKGLGNFYVDFVRIITRVLLPLSIIVGIVLISQGVPQTLESNITAQTIEGKFQDIAMGPIASLESIKHLGTNGGGFLGANSSTPFENPNVLTNMIEMLSMMLLPGSCVIAFGHMISHRNKENHKKTSKEMRPIFIVMLILFLVGLGACTYFELKGNPVISQMGFGEQYGNMEGKEARFGIIHSALFTTVTTAFTTGSVNNMHDSLTPLGGAVPLMNMMLNVVFGGKGVGLMNMLLYVILTVFICGLMIGRTPEYLGKKIEGKEMKLAALGIIIHPLLILSFSALAVVVPAGLNGISNGGYHGLSQILYEYASSAANNGSGFEGLADNTYFWNITTGVVMFFGRYLAMIIQLALAGSLLNKPVMAESVGTLKTGNATFTIALLMIVIVFVALTFFPVMALGPIAEHLTLLR